MYLLVPLYMLWIHIIVNLFIYMLFVREDDIYILYMNVVDLGLLCVRINQILCLQCHEDFYLLLIILILCTVHIYIIYTYIYISILSQNNRKHYLNLQEHQVVNLAKKGNSTIPCTHAVGLLFWRKSPGGKGSTHHQLLVTSLERKFHHFSQRFRKFTPGVGGVGGGHWDVYWKSPKVVVIHRSLDPTSSSLGVFFFMSSFGEIFLVDVSMFHDTCPRGMFTYTFNHQFFSRLNLGRHSHISGASGQHMTFDVVNTVRVSLMENHLGCGTCCNS